MKKILMLLGLCLVSITMIGCKDSIWGMCTGECEKPVQVEIETN